MKKLKTETNDVEIKGIRNLFRLKKENTVIKGRINRDIRNAFEHGEEENYYKPIRVGNFCSSNFIKFKSNYDRKVIKDKIIRDTRNAFEREEENC